MNFRFDPASMNIIPLWVKFPRLPVGYWSVEALSKLASVVGRPLYTDKYTTNLEKVSYARILVETDISKPLPEFVEIDTPEETIHQIIDYDWRPKFCIDCIRIGHEKTNCWKNKPTPPVQEVVGEPPKEKKRTRNRRRKMRQEWQPITDLAEATNEIAPVDLAAVTTGTIPADAPVVENEFINDGATHTSVEKNSQLEISSREPVATLTQRHRKQQISTNIMQYLVPTDFKHWMRLILLGISKELRLFLARNKVDFIGCLETRVKEHKSKKILQKIARGWSHCFNYPLATNGRVWLLWRDHIKVQVLDIKEQYIHCYVEEPSTKFSTFLTVVYARNQLNLRELLWTELSQLGQLQGPWLLCGDFNNILSTEDKIGLPVCQNEIQGLRDRLDTMQLTPLRSRGRHFTWCNKQQSSNRVYNHSPILIQSYKQVTLHPKPFRLFTNILGHTEFPQLLEDVWQQVETGPPIQRIWRKLKNMKNKLKDLNKYMASYEQKLNHARQALEMIQAKLCLQPLDQQLLEHEKGILPDVEKWSTVDEQVLRQKSRACWIDCGDSNSKFFHAQWKIRNNRNAISSVYTETGIKLTDPLLVEEEFTAFFTSLMGQSA
ncbi:uncharacterized protein LOC132619932 [Lycium barbarum]|uniref:uncharacterized protein LOC132619932 n=1 Tax=Lycium barbarum TaxID=112863 RepID=UPI00293ECA6F|nr:uncharacterized protein LOC132619932 [Lycium barbarum]